MKDAAEFYIDYIRMSHKDLPVISSILAAPGETSDKVTEFHSQLCKAMEGNGYSFCGIKVVPPSAECLQPFRATAPICVPLFSFIFDEKTPLLHLKHVQFIESGMCLTVGERGQNTESVSIDSFCPYIELTGSRFSCHPTSLNGLACDLCGSMHITKGPENPFPHLNNTKLNDHHFVLTCGEEPVSVGVAKRCLGTFEEVSNVCSTYASKIGNPLRKGDVIVLGGCCPRVPAEEGHYTSRWGLYGEVTYTIC